eukprot:gene22765-31055_t
MCPVAFCEDCLPVDHEIIGPLSERWAPLGYKPLRTGCFIFCSPECKQFNVDVAEREKKDSSQVVVTPQVPKKRKS